MGSLRRWNEFGENTDSLGAFSEWWADDAGEEGVGSEVCAKTLKQDGEEEVVERQRFRKERVGLDGRAEGGPGNCKKLRVPVVEDVIFNQLQNETDGCDFLVNNVHLLFRTLILKRGL